MSLSRVVAVVNAAGKISLVIEPLNDSLNDPPILAVPLVVSTIFINLLIPLRLFDPYVIKGKFPAISTTDVKVTLNELVKEAVFGEQAWIEGESNVTMTVLMFAKACNAFVMSMIVAS
jgi:hypothetical protein